MLFVFICYRTPEERDEWLEALNSAIDETAQRRGTFESVKAGMQVNYYTTTNKV